MYLVMMTAKVFKHSLAEKYLVLVAQRLHCFSRNDLLAVKVKARKLEETNTDANQTPGQDPREINVTEHNVTLLLVKM